MSRFLDCFEIFFSTFLKKNSFFLQFFVSDFFLKYFLNFVFIIC